MLFFLESITYFSDINICFICEIQVSCYIFYGHLFNFIERWTLDQQDVEKLRKEITNTLFAIS
jgi:hypothetical protein